MKLTTAQKIGTSVFIVAALAIFAYALSFMTEFRVIRIYSEDRMIDFELMTLYRALHDYNNLVFMAGTTLLVLAGLTLFFDIRKQPLHKNGWIYSTIVGVIMFVASIVFYVQNLGLHQVFKEADFTWRATYITPELAGYRVPTDFWLVVGQPLFIITAIVALGFTVIITVNHFKNKGGN